MTCMDVKIDAARRKRLGQFFSGVLLGRLLAGMTNVTMAQSIIDPMVGCGDLLQGCYDLNASAEIIAGIEIDAAAAERAADRLPAARIVIGDAFDPATLAALPTIGYDLVIGNPPFVRYQDNSTSSHGLPDAASVRLNLARAVELFDHQAPSDLTMYRSMIAEYSGLADLAVPACILSMLLVRPGGELALVLPQSWLSREYALPVRYALETHFDLIAIIEDEGAAWFNDALVKTALIVAQRTHPSVKSRRVQRSPAHVRLKTGAGDQRSLVGLLAPGVSRPEIVVGEMIRTGLYTDTALQSGLIENRVFGGLNHMRSESTSDGNSRGPWLPPEMSDLAGMLAEPVLELQNLEIVANQGLRTGANDFFYVEANAGGSAFRTSLSLGGRTVDRTQTLVIPAIRDQRSLRTRLMDSEGWHDAILDLRSVALPEDLEGADAVTQRSYRKMPERLAQHVRHAATALSGKPGRKRPIPELSAVATNVRAARKGRPARFWYQLPDFQNRHRPDLYVARVNAGRPKFFLNADREALVDANFITLRCPEDMNPVAVQAVLNSTWTWAYLELVGAVMGGGALKIEAAMLQRLAIPTLSPAQWRSIEAIVRTHGKTGPQFDCTHTLLGCASPEHESVTALRRIAGERLAARSAQRHI